MTNTLLLPVLLTVMVFGVSARRNTALLVCNNDRSIRGEEEASTDSPLVVPADCTKGRVMWTLPNPDTSLSVQFQGLTSSYCFVSRYPQMFANYAVLENGVSTTPYTDNEHCISTPNVELSVFRRYYLVYIDFESRT
uniref:Uncharacterized protein LOC111101319 n=1 Tax=Crassostrea virginica TaxID=6565 RepID=A0A8B8AG32_CRAVI|nr:uncharacterized protein LOC111101319 [Crassostrea virginica]